MRGFEPLTPWMQTRCSAGLSYIPAVAMLRNPRQARPNPRLDPAPVGRVASMQLGARPHTSTVVATIGTRFEDRRAPTPNHPNHTGRSTNDG